MFLIIFYHLLLWFVQDNPAYGWVRALWIPLHIGVVCFILISGYFRIRPSSRGLLTLLCVLFVYSLPGIIHSIRNADSVYDIIHPLMFISHSEFWFVKTYLALYLVSPLLNNFFDHTSLRGQWYLLGVFALIAIYFGHFSQDAAFKEGKNVVNFMLIYQVGNMLKEYASRWKSLKMNRLIGVYLGLNVLLVTLFSLTRGSGMGTIFWKLCFPYNSPLLILNAVLLFVVFGKMEFRSRLVNRLAEHCFAIYLIHGLPLMIVGVERPFIHRVLLFTDGNILAIIPLLFILACLIMAGCIAIDCLFRPLWKWVDRLGTGIQVRFVF